MRNSASYVSAHWLGFICLAGARGFYGGRKCKLIARSVSNGNGVSGDWREIGKNDFVVGLAVQLDSKKLGAYAVLGADGWPIVRAETGPKLKAVISDWSPKILTFSKTG